MLLCLLSDGLRWLICFGVFENFGKVFWMIVLLRFGLLIVRNVLCVV